jgi:hypothetical protein
MGLASSCQPVNEGSQILPRSATTDAKQRPIPCTCVIMPISQATVTDDNLSRGAGKMTIFINPGSGPVADATIENASFNMGAFTGDLLRLDDSAIPSVERRSEMDDDGRYCFVLRFPDREVEVEMPGLPLAQVRWLDEPGQNIWDFPRLYVDGSSWVWKYALNAALSSEEEDVD